MQHLSKTRMSEYDLEMEEENSVGLEAENEDHDSDEDTEDASETDMVKQEEEYTEIKEQMYQDKLANLKKQLQQLEDGTHPEYLRRLKKLEQAYQDRLLLNEVFQSYEIERVEREYINEKKAAVRDFEEKKIELRENLIAELEEKKRLIEAERSTMELTGAINRHIIGEYVTDSMEVKPVTTRKLRRRPNDPLPLPEKRRKTSPTQLNYLLEENEILEDLKLINRGKLPGGNKRQEREVRSLQRQNYMQNSGSASDGISSSEHCGTSTEVRVEDGKLYYDKKWFHRGQPVYYEGKEAGTRNSGVIGTISSSEIWIKRAADGAKIRIYISQLQKGKFTIRRRSS